jgi:adenosylcobinamide-GDP ribazoletransferase
VRCPVPRVKSEPRARASIPRVTGLVAAVRYLTIVPIPGRAARDEGPGRAAAWFPVIGVAIGGALLLVDRLTGALVAPLLAAALTVTVWKGLTGGLHLDGLADCFDGLMGRDPEHRLAIMRDSRIGAFGAIALVFTVILQIAAVSGVDAGVRAGALLVAPTVGRALPPMVARVFPAPAGGHGAGFRASVGSAAAPVALVLAAIVAVAALGTAAGLLSVAVAVGVALGIGALMTRRLGGVSGDVYGAVVELGELAVLLMIAALHPAR